jgi:uncharacterized protein YodC (DUF2158 family)
MSEATEEKDPNERRLKVLHIDRSLLGEIFRDGIRPFSLKVANGIPRYAKVVDHDYDPESKRFTLVIQDASFGVVPDGKEIPYLDPQVSRSELASPQKQIEVGSVVRLWSGGPKMTVNSMSDTIAGCVFFDHNAPAVLCRAEVPLGCLELVS